LSTCTPVARTTIPPYIHAYFVHGKDEATKRAKLKKQLEAAVDKAFEQDKDDVPASFRSLFTAGADNVKQATTSGDDTTLARNSMTGG
jgi:hypothetical protein